MVFQHIKVYPFITSRKKGQFTMLKKLISLLLSLLIFLSLLPTQSLEDDVSEENSLSTVIETPAPIWPLCFRLLREAVGPALLGKVLP